MTGLDMENVKLVPYWDVKNIKEIKTEKDVATEFEATFLRILLKEMRNTIPDSGLFSSFSEKMYTDMFDMTVADTLASSDKLGLSDYIENAIKSYKQVKNL